MLAHIHFEVPVLISFSYNLSSYNIRQEKELELRNKLQLGICVLLVNIDMFGSELNSITKILLKRV
jgi:hypothetical protein